MLTLPIVPMSVVGRRLLFLRVHHVRGVDVAQVLHDLPEIDLQLLYGDLLPGDDLIQLLDGVFMVHQLYLDVGYPLFHIRSLPGLAVCTGLVKQADFRSSHQPTRITGQKWPIRPQ
jgi:hypothetical protein